MRKICTKCKTNKLYSEFNKKSKSKDGLSLQCKECNKLYLKQHYLNNKDLYYERNKKKREELKLWFKTYKETLKCNICPEERSWVLEFHHSDPEEKEGYIIDILLRFGKKRALIELEKCVVLCANCHRDVHYHMKQ